MASTLTIGKVAKSAGVRVDTVRYYERRGLIPRARRRPSGYRDFPADTVQRIRFIKRAQELGFTLDEITELLQLRSNPGARCGDVLELAEDKLQLIEEKITDLQSIRDALRRLATACRKGRSVLECPLIESLEREG